MSSSGILPVTLPGHLKQQLKAALPRAEMQDLGASVSFGPLRQRLPLSPANHPGSAQPRNSSPGLHRRLVFPKHLEARADQVLHSAATPSIMGCLFQPHSKANIRLPSSPGHRCWPKLQLPFSPRFHSSSGGNRAQLCPEGFSPHQFFPPKCQESPN